MDRLKNYGHRQFYPDVLNLVNTASENDWKNEIYSKFGEDEQVLGFVHNLKETKKELEGSEAYNSMTAEDFERGIDAWDMGRLVYLARMGNQLGFIDAKEAWFYINSAHQRSKEAYNSWKEFGKGYVIGRSMWGGESMGLDGIKHIVNDLQKDEASPWNGLAW